MVKVHFVHGLLLSLASCLPHEINQTSNNLLAIPGENATHSSQQTASQVRNTTKAQIGEINNIELTTVAQIGEKDNTELTTVAQIGEIYSTELTVAQIGEIYNTELTTVAQIGEIDIELATVKAHTSTKQDAGKSREGETDQTTKPLGNDSGVKRRTPEYSIFKAFTSSYETMSTWGTTYSIVFGTKASPANETATETPIEPVKPSENTTETPIKSSPQHTNTTIYVPNDVKTKDKQSGKQVTTQPEETESNDVEVTDNDGFRNTEENEAKSEEQRPMNSAVHISFKRHLLTLLLVGRTLTTTN